MRYLRGIEMRLPRSIYEIVPYFLIGIGAVFIYLVLRQYEYAPTLFIWLLGIFCIIAGIAMIVIRSMHRYAAKSNAQADYEDDD
jgi:uncharacterized membrane protein HdeD (DUF308 family)